MGIPVISELVESTVGRLVDKALAYLPEDPQTRAAAARELREHALQIALAQNEINKMAMQSGSTFLAGGRQAFLWVGACGFGYSLMVQPLIVTVTLWFNPDFPVERLPAIDWTKMSGVVLGLLGLG
jgi:Holin of 3TMs, for gene-transfer release